MSKVDFMLDEAAMLGPMDVIDNAVGIGRGYGIRLYFFYQSLGQLRKCFPEGQDQNLLSNVSEIYFGVNDYPTADYVSARLGDETIIVESGGTSRGTSSSASHGSQASRNESSSFTRNYNWSQQARRLLKPEEVIALSPRIAITFTPGMPPIWTTTVRSYEEKNMAALVRSQNGSARSIRELIKATLYFAFALFVAVVLTLAREIQLKQITDDGGGRQSNYTEQGVDHVTGE